MSKTAIYPGSFNPLHEGHIDIIKKALKCFEHVTVLRMQNPGKDLSDYPMPKAELYALGNVSVLEANGMLVDVVKMLDGCAVIRGLRNGNDLETERIQQYWNEDLGLVVPTVYFITDRSLIHVSSSALRMIEKLKESK